MKFSKLPVGSCFRLSRNGSVHKKMSTDTYAVDGFAPEVELAGDAKVLKAGCALPGRPKQLIELGKRKKSR